MVLDHFRVVATQPLAADREAAEAFALFDARGLQQRQCRTARAEENELGVDFTGVAAVDVLDADGPAAVAALEAGHALAVLDLGIGCAGQVLEQLVGQGAEVDVGAIDHAGRGEGFARIAARHHQRHPLGHFGLVFGVLHVGEGVVLAQHLEAFLEEGHAAVALHETQVWHRADKRFARAERAFFGQVRPELLRHLELGVDVHGFLDVDGAIGGLRRVVELTQPGVTGTGVVPRVGTLRGTGIHQLDDFQLDRGVELFEQYCKGGTHDAGPNQYYVDCFVMRHLTRLQNLQHQIVGMAARSDGACQCCPRYPWQDRHVRIFAIYRNFDGRYLPGLIRVI
ncbi:hypothetical protein D3C72_960320 [compost metagenome]